MATPQITGKKLIIAAFPGDSVLPDATLHGTIVAQGRSRFEKGTAYILESDEPAREVLRTHTADPRWFLIDLEDMPASRLPGMAQYIGGAFVRLYGKMSIGELVDSSQFPAYLGLGEVLQRDDQPLLRVPPIAHAREAAHVIELTRRDFGVKLRIELSSIRRAAKVIASTGLGGLPQGLPEQVGFGRLLSLWGDFFGECLVRHYQGRWFEDPKLGLVVLIPRGQLPPAKVRPYRVIEHTIRQRDSSPVEEWLSKIEKAKDSTDFNPPFVE